MTAARANPRPTASLKLKVTPLEDLHSGSGLGAASVDALLARDRFGQPVIRWSHVKGLLIEALRERCAALGKRDAEASVERLFGKADEHGTSRGIVRGRSLRIASGAVGSDKAIVWSSTARVPETRVPLDDTLRRIEFVRAGTVFEGEVRVPGGINDEEAQLVAKLLGRLSRLGGGRSRGAGLVHIELKSGELPAPHIETSQARTAQPLCELRVVFRALEPLCLAATGQPRNLIASHSHLAPGTVAGMLARWALDHGATTLAESLLEGRIVCGPGYPVPLECGTDPRRVDSVPIPLSLQSPKPPEQRGSPPWWAANPQPREVTDDLARDDDKRRREKLKRPGAHDYLVTTDGNQWKLFVCPMGVALRNDAGHSRLKPAKQNLFSVEEIAEDTGFVARLVAQPREAAALESALQALQGDGHWLQAGRGGAPLAVAAYAKLDAASRGARKSAGNDSELRIFVESDLILRAPDLCFRTRLDRAAVLALLEAAGVDPQSAQCLEAEPEHASEPFTVRGWNVATGSRRIPAIAIRRGSVAALKFSDAAAAKVCGTALRERGYFGLGERASEGYGRIRVDFAPMPVDQVFGTESEPQENRSESVLKKVEDLLRGAMPDFPTSRWQALRNAAADNRLLDAWFEQAERRVKEAARDKTSAEAQEQWLDKRLKAERNHHEVLRALGLAAAKLAKRKQRKTHRSQEAQVRER